MPEFCAQEITKRGCLMRKRNRPQRSPDDMRDWYVIGVIAVMTALSAWVPVLSKANSRVDSSTVALSRSR